MKKNGLSKELKKINNIIPPPEKKSKEGKKKKEAMSQIINGIK